MGDESPIFRQYKMSKKRSTLKHLKVLPRYRVVLQLMRFFSLIIVICLLATASRPIPVPEKAESGMEEVVAVTTCSQAEKISPRPLVKISRKTVAFFSRFDRKHYAHRSITRLPSGKLYLEHRVLLI